MANTDSLGREQLVNKIQHILRGILEERVNRINRLEGIVDWVMRTTVCS